MNAIALMDMGCTIFFLAAFSITVTMPSNRIGKLPKIFLSVCMFIYVLTCLFNVLEHSDITALFDTTEDYLELLFIPLILFFFYSLSIERETRARKKAEETLRLHHHIIGQSTYSIISTGLEGNITSWNLGSEKLFGYIADEMLGKHISAVYPEEELEYLNNEIIPPLKKKGSHEIEVRLQRKSGEKFDALLSLWLLNDMDGNPVGMVGYTLDITERKRSEEETLRSLREKEVLLSEVHHRVKNNLAVISALLNMQAGNLGDMAAKEAFNECQGRIMSMALVHEGLYKSEDFSNINFSSYMKKLLGNLFRTYNTKPGRIAMVTEIEDMPVDLETAIPLGLLMNELLTNSLKHAFPERRKGTVTVTARKSGEIVEIIVSDDGIGLPEGFDIEAPVTLGMQVVISLVAQLNARMEVEHGQGARFTITIPVHT